MILSSITVNNHGRAQRTPALADHGKAGTFLRLRPRCPHRPRAWQSSRRGYTRRAVPDETEISTPQPAEAATSPEVEPTPALEPAPEPVQDPLELAQAEQQKLKDQLLRTLADFDNFRKRTRRELVDAERRGKDDILKEFLPVFDNLDRAGAHAETATDVKALAQGITLVMRQFGDTLGRVGIERIPTVGQPFDPSVHEAVQQMETSDFEPGVIAAEVQAGYRSSEKLIRPALVVVAKAKAN